MLTVMAALLSLLAWFSTLAFGLLSSVPAATAEASTVILISFDGSPWNVMKRRKTPTFDEIVRTGVKSYVHNVFPSETFPNHYTIVTGLYPESHGIIGNNIYDPVWNATFSMANNESRWWDGGEPLWVTNQKQGGRSGLCFWPGYNVKIRGYFPTNGTKDLGYDMPFLDLPSMNSTDRIDIVIDWLTQDIPVSFVALYFDSPDFDGHKWGIDSEEFGEAVRRNDNITGYLLQRLREKKLYDKVNVIITADHGMTNINANSTVNIDHYVDQALYTVWSWSSAYFMVNPRHEDNRTALYSALKAAEESEPGKLKVYRKEEIPVELHYANSRRVADFLVIMTEGIVAASSKQRSRALSWPKNFTASTHGYLPSFKDMQPFFIAHGPAFKEGHVSDPFDMVHIYPLICHLLGIEPAPNNGSLAKVIHLLKESDSMQESQKSNRMPTAELMALVIGCCCVFGCFLAGIWMFYKRRSRMGYQQGPESIIPLMADDSDNEDIFL